MVANEITHKIWARVVDVAMKLARLIKQRVGGDGTPLKSSLVQEGIEDIFALISLVEIAIHGLT
jgi:hypothetical protein